MSFHTSTRILLKGKQWFAMMCLGKSYLGLDLCSQFLLSDNVSNCTLQLTKRISLLSNQKIMRKIQG